jgi:hypothetical protein
MKNKNRFLVALVTTASRMIGIGLLGLSFLLMGCGKTDYTKSSAIGSWAVPPKRAGIVHSPSYVPALLEIKPDGTARSTSASETGAKPQSEGWHLFWSQSGNTLTFKGDAGKSKGMPSYLAPVANVMTSSMMNMTATVSSDGKSLTLVKGANGKTNTTYYVRWDGKH